MIFVTVGTQLPFDRLMRGVDRWAARHPETRVVAQTGQIGPGDFHPQHMICNAKLEPDAFDQHCRAARLLVAHAGTGSLLKAHVFDTPILMMPRRAALGEHRNDHQVATAQYLGERTGATIVLEEDEVGPAIDALLNGPHAAPKLSAFADASLITALRATIFSDA